MEDVPSPLGDGFGFGSGVEGGLIAGEPDVAADDEGLGVLAGRQKHSGISVVGACISRIVCSSRCAAKIASSHRSMAGSTSASPR